MTKNCRLFKKKNFEAFKDITRNPFAFFMEWSLDVFPKLTGWEKT